MISKVRYFFFNCSLFILWALLISILRIKFGLAPWFLLFSFMFFIFAPGFFIAKIFNINFLKDTSGQIVLRLAMGLIFNLLIALLAVFIGLTLQQLEIVYFTLIILLFIIAAVFDIRRATYELIKIDWRTIFAKSNILLGLAAVILLLILVTIDDQGANFKGDPFYHLAIMRKVVSGESLLAQNLNYIKTAQVHPAYGFPIWHVFLGLLSKLTNSNIFTVWAGLPVSLSILAFIVWYWLIKNIFKHKEVSILTLLLFAVFTYRYLDGYLYTRFPVPDTLCQLLLLPLVISLALKYIFDKDTDYKTLLTFSLLSLLMAAIHFSQYFYFLIVMTVFLLAYLIFGIGKEDYKFTLKRIFWSISTSVLMILPFVLLLELKGKTVSSTVKSYWAVDITKQKLGYRLFKGVEVLAKYAYIATPLILLFAKKNRRLIFLFALFLVIPLAYSESIGFIKLYLTKTLGYIFINRFYSNVTWDFIVWGLLLGFILLLADRLMSYFLAKPSVTKKAIVYTKNFALFLIAFLMVYLENSSQIISKFFSRTVTSANTISWLNSNFHWLVFLLALLVILGLILQKFSKKFESFFEFSEIKNPVTFTLLTFILVFLFFSPNYKNFNRLLKENFNTRKVFVSTKDYAGSVVNYKNIGDKRTEEFIQESIPSKSIFIADKIAQNTLPLTNDIFMAAYPRTPEEKEYWRIYKDVPKETKLDILRKSKAEYVFFSVPSVQAENFFAENPTYFTLVYKDDIAIYRVKKEELTNP